MSAGVLGRSRFCTCNLVAVHGGFGVAGASGRRVSGVVRGIGLAGTPGCRVSGVTGGGCDAMSTLQRRGPVCSRVPWRILRPSLLWTSSLFLSM
jgi:hypothetical protein